MVRSIPLLPYAWLTGAAVRRLPPPPYELLLLLLIPTSTVCEHDTPITPTLIEGKQTLMNTCSIARASQEYAGRVNRGDLVREAVHDEGALAGPGVSSYYHAPLECRGQYGGRPSNAC